MHEILYYFIYALLFNLNIGKTSKRERLRRVIYCDTLVCENRVHHEKARRRITIPYTPSPQNKNNCSHGHAESMVIDSIPWHPQRSLVNGAGDGGGFSQNTLLGLRV
jgi:hypothetical protein